MTYLFYKIVNMSIASCWIIVAVILLRLLLKKAPKWIFVLLWGLVAVRLIMPFSIKSPFGLIPSQNMIQPEAIIIISSMDQIILKIWMSGILIFVFCSIVSYLTVFCKVWNGIPITHNIYQCKNISFPFILGIFEPIIYLPVDMTEKEIASVTSHEVAHIRRRDHWWKWIGFLLLIIHWFNPLVWVSYILFCQDVEFACDERVIKKMNKEERASYVQTLLDYSISKKVPVNSLLSFGEVNVRERIVNILSYQKPSCSIIFVGLLASFVIGICFLTNSANHDYTLEKIPVGNEKLLWNMSAEEVIDILGDPTFTAYNEDRTTATLVYTNYIPCAFGNCSRLVMRFNTDEAAVRSGNPLKSELYYIHLKLDDISVSRLQTALKMYYPNPFNQEPLLQIQFIETGSQVILQTKN